MKYAIVNTTIVLTDHLIPDGVIIIEDGKIADFGKANKVSTEGLECIDAGGKYIGPGLIDIHTHAGAGTFFYEDPVFAAEKILEHGFTDVLPAHYFNLNKDKLVHYNPANDEEGYLSACRLSELDSMSVEVYGNEERILLVARYDNLGKGASGAAVECLNIKLGCDKTLDRKSVV